MYEKLNKLFVDSFGEFAKNDLSNIENDCSERNLCQRLSFSLEKMAKECGYKGYYADVEYNRNNRKIKTIFDKSATTKKYEVIKVTCDLILHSRGHVIEKDNLIAIEMKKVGNRRGIGGDRKRLKLLTMSSFDDIWSADGNTLPQHVCGYSLGYMIISDKCNNRFLIEKYREGQKFEDVVFEY